MTKAFDYHSDKWLDYQEKPWGVLFYVQSHKYLAPFIPAQQSKILDLGGGTGRSSIPFAEDGHEVTIIDLAEDLLNEANQLAKEAGVDDRISLINSDIHDLSRLFSASEFDVVLCHNVLGYQDNIEDTSKSVVNCLKPNGVISLISMNQFSEVYRTILKDHDPNSAIDAIGNKEYTSKTFNEPITLLSADETAKLFNSYGCSVEGHFGIRCVNDYISNDEIKSDPSFFKKLTELELSLGKRHPYKLVARFFHLIIRKSS